MVCGSPCVHLRLVDVGHKKRVHDVHSTLGAHVCPWGLGFETARDLHSRGGCRNCRRQRWVEFSVLCNTQLSFALLAYLTRFLWRPTVVRQVCESELDKLNMKGWFRTIVTDGGSNVKGAFDHVGGWGWLRCGCHVLHNVVCAGLTWV